MTQLTREAREELIKIRERGQSLEPLEEAIESITSSIIDRCKEEFSTMEPVCYQNIDNNRVFMLQLEMKVARQIITAVKVAIVDAQQAEEILEKDY